MIDDEYGVFVTPTGDDQTGLGTQAAPFASVARGVAEAKTAGKHLYVCADVAEYREHLALSADSAGVSAYGSFRCADWGYDTSLRARVAPATEGYAFEAHSINVATRLEGFEFKAQSAREFGGNSVAGFVKTSSALTLVRVKFVAGDGVQGATGSRTDFPAPSVRVNGNPGTVAAGGEGGGPVACPGGGTTQGGTGGGITTGGGMGLPAPTPPNFNGGASGPACDQQGGGGIGVPGTTGPGGPGASNSGTLAASAWQPAPGGAGSPGTVGQGGGGGRGGTTGGGGGGGAGGCGGAGGGGGGGGGASIALLLLNSPVRLQDLELVAAAAGNGGAGGNGQRGLFGGIDGAGFGVGSPTSFGCWGGGGGTGGAGGGGGGGAGGVSVGILYVGTAPTRTGGSTTTGTAGAPGPGGLAGGEGPAAASGVAGVSEDELEVTL